LNADRSQQKNDSAPSGVFSQSFKDEVHVLCVVSKEFEVQYCQCKQRQSGNASCRSIMRSAENHDSPTTIPRNAPISLATWSGVLLHVATHVTSHGPQN
jgi:hypothetical protein